MGCAEEFPVQGVSPELQNKLYKVLGFNDKDKSGFIEKKPFWKLWEKEGYKKEADIDEDGKLIGAEIRYYLHYLHYVEENDNKEIEELEELKQENPFSEEDQKVVSVMFAENKKQNIAPLPYFEDAHQNWRYYFHETSHCGYEILKEVSEDLEDLEDLILESRPYSFIGCLSRLRRLYDDIRTRKMAGRIREAAEEEFEKMEQNSEYRYDINRVIRSAYDPIYTFTHFVECLQEGKSSEEPGEKIVTESLPNTAAPKPFPGEVYFVSPKVEGNVCGRTLDWGKEPLKEWRENPVETVNRGLDGLFYYKAKTSPEYRGWIVDTDVCPILSEPDRCWPQDIDEVDENGYIGKETRVFFRLPHWTPTVTVRLLFSSDSEDLRHPEYECRIGFDAK